ncbi:MULTISPECIES: CRISPR-associated protein Csn2-St [Listeria]|uniref:CRISPR-associated protein Csn2-St n=1 Tax=Listeria TaxID=1637 RepID=UPI000B58BA58|nr:MULTISPECIES: CRISPR-associated protein Csn2-St [Listeria]
MSKFTFSNPKLKRVEMEFSQLTQVIGDNTELKQQLWQNMSWYLSKHKYTESELSILNYSEPQIWEDGNDLSRNKFRTIIIESITDIHGLLNANKGTPTFDVLNQMMAKLEISKYIEKINQEMSQIEKQLNANEELQKLNEEQKYKWKVVVEEFNSKSLLQKNVSFTPMYQDGAYATEYIDGYTKYMILLDLLEINLETSSETILLMIKNIDDTLRYNEFEEVMDLIKQLTLKYSNFYCMVFPSQIGYVYVSEEYIDSILVMGEEAHSLFDSVTLYERVCSHYPDKIMPTYHEFLSCLKIVAPYLFTSKKQSIRMNVKELVLIKLINELFQYFEFTPAPAMLHSQLEYNFLYES